MFTSCVKDEHFYSCDPTIEEYVKSHISEINTMTRADILGLQPMVTKAFYNAFTAEHKLAFWIDKLNEVLLLDWNDEEMNHINMLIDYINENNYIFDNSFNENSEKWDSFELAIYKWVIYAEDVLKWDKKLVANIIASGDKLINKKGELAIPIKSNSPMVLNRSEIDCKCSTQSDWCFTMNTTCGTTFRDCKPVDGCGTFFQYVCDGLCHNGD